MLLLIRLYCFVIGYSDGELCVFILDTCHADVAIVVLYDLATQVQTYARCFAGGLCGEEWVEDLVENRLFYTDAIVMDLQNVLFFSYCGCKRNFGSIILHLLGFLDYGINCVVQQVHNGLAEHGGITVQGHGAIRQGKRYLDMILLQVALSL